MSAPAASPSSPAAERVQALLAEHAVALASLADAHAAVQIALHLHTLQRPEVKCVALGEQEGDAGKVLPTIPAGWSASADGFCFLYSAPSSRRLLVKSIRMDRALLVHAALKAAAGGAAAGGGGAGAQQQPIRSLDISVDDHINSAALRGSAASAGSSAPVASSSAGPDFASLYKDLPGLLALYDRSVLDPLLPKPASAEEGAQKSGQAPPAAQGYDPLRVPPRGQIPPQFGGDDDDNPYLRDPFNRRPRGDFAGDLDPLAVGGPNSGNLMGPRNFPGMGGMGGPGGPRGPPGMAPRFDPYGPVPGMGDPDFDEFAPPGPGGPNLGGLGGPGFGPGFGPPRGGLGGPRGRGGPGFGGPGFGGPGGGMGPRFGGPGGFGGGGIM